jgi:hypothetical protein
LTVSTWLDRSEENVPKVLFCLGLLPEQTLRQGFDKLNPAAQDSAFGTLLTDLCNRQ